MVSKAQMEAKKKYEAKTYERISLRVKVGERDAIRSAADAAGKSLNAFIVDAVMDKLAISPPPGTKKTNIIVV